MRLCASIRTTRPRFPFATFGFYRGPMRIKFQGLEGPKGIVEPRMKNLIEVSVDSIRIHMPTAQHLVILKEKEADRYLPIWIGSSEAQAIATKISGNPLGRPLTHDLMATAFSDLGISVKRIVVTRLADQVFYARLYVKQNGRDLDFDARPSDAIALAVRVECPIFVAEEVMESAGITPDADEEAREKDKAETPVDEERLAVFRDFVNSLDLPELPDEPGAKGEPGTKDKAGGRPRRRCAAAAHRGLRRLRPSASGGTHSRSDPWDREGVSRTSGGDQDDGADCSRRVHVHHARAAPRVRNTGRPDAHRGPDRDRCRFSRGRKHSPPGRRRPWSDDGCVDLGGRVAGHGRRVRLLRDRSLHRLSRNRDVGGDPAARAAVFQKQEPALHG